MTAWPEERIAELEKLTVAGLSAAQIAMRLGVTRNAVCGRWDRDPLLRARRKLAPKPAPRPRAVAPKPSPRPRVAVPKPKFTPVWHPADTKGPKPLDLTLLQLTATACKWPINDDNPFRFCGVDKPVEGGPYCPYHTKVASGGVPSRKRQAG